MRSANEQRGEARYRGEVVYFYAFDIAVEVRTAALTHLLGSELRPFAVEPGHRTPRHWLFRTPIMLDLPAVSCPGPLGRCEVSRSAKILPIGAISLSLRVPFAVADLGELVGFHELGTEGGGVHEEAVRLAEQLRTELAPVLVRPAPKLAEEEAYTVFCLDAAPDRSPGLGVAGVGETAEWLGAHRAAIAALLTQESDPRRLSAQEVQESTARALSYYRSDLVVVDWDAALVVEAAGAMEETLFVLELANLQLTELEAYDRLLDDRLNLAYRDLTVRPWTRRSAVLGELREIRIDLARFRDELFNLAKCFGDWHLARVYEGIAARFHLEDWQRSAEQKHHTLDSLYQLLKQERDNRWMLLLETSIVVLFILDLIVLGMGLQK